MPISPWIITAIGFFAQILFLSRTLVQWILSEKSKQVLAPILFWKLSLIASILMFYYGYLRNDFAIMLGQTITYFVYIRNLHIQNSWQKISIWIRILIIIFPFIIVTLVFSNQANDFENIFRNENIPLWLLVFGSIAQIVFTFRFVYQWMVAERTKNSTLPKGFWMLSLIGAVLNITYAIYRMDPVLLAGHSLGMLVYVRNLMLLQQQSMKSN